MAYLDTIDSPADVKKLNVEQLTELAGEIRESLIRTLADTGGHLGPNLGVVEVSLAFHKVFDSPKDRIVMDVAHQAYVHKMLTGRRDRMHTIRQTDGLCGFMVRSESPHDHFGAGHAGTALSAALGMAAARDKAGTGEHVVALVGDAALTCGITYEAMNNIKHTTKRLIVILNDNEWSIDRNVGGMAKHLNRIVTNPTYNRLHKDFDSFLKKVPFGDRLLKLEHRAEEAAKGILYPSVIFEELGLRYLGPIDGHDLKMLITNLEFCKQSDEPILLHIRTTKGKGAHFALENPEKFHGCSPYDPVTGKSKPSKPAPPAWQDVFGELMLKFCQTHAKLVGITGAMPSGTGLSKLRDKMPDRYFDVGIAEEHAVIFAAGMATMGFRPVVAIYSTFLQRAYDCIIHDVALQNLPVIFCMDRAGLSAADGPTHHGLFDIAYARAVPGTVLMQPKDEDEFQDMFATALTLNAPVFIRYPRGAAMGVPMKDHPQILPLGKAEVLQHGHDVAIFSYGTMLPMAQNAAKLLAEQHGLSVALINARFAKPLDVECVERYARQCKALLSFEDHVLTGGIGDAIIGHLADARIHTPVARVAWPDKFIEWASTNDLLRERHGVTAQAGVEKVMAILREQESDPRFQVVAVK
ncbi:MAG: 1-deoxy-D-xylulose-5-phosphate synthase [Verrucomicrobia bacterium]|nr:1-deoxy-D-xylulose-5-phosphate synthase [Verrucomicrobiota bacterium]